MSRFCIDTSAYSHFQRGDEQIVEILDRADWIGVPVIALGEIRTGFLLGGRQAANEAELLEFLAHPVVEVLNVDHDASRHFAEIVVDLRRAGTPLPTNDIWIAASAIRAGAVVVTYDRHFEEIVRVGSLVLGS